MLSQLFNWFDLALEVINQSNRRVIWNLFLALIPLIFSFYLFRPSVSRSVIWWACLLIFIAFLPNAPYILTDTIHLLELIARNYPRSIVILVLMPQYIFFVLAGFQAYVIALMRLDNYLISLEQSPYLVTVNAIIHGLCAVGVYLGRFERFNSWDLVTQPQIVIATTLRDLVHLEPIISLAIAFSLLWGLTEFVKLHNLKIIEVIFNRYQKSVN